MAVLTINQYIDTINSFINNVTNSQNSYYVFYGKPTSWVNANGQPDDTAIPAANGSVYSYEQSIYHDIVFGKLINSGDVSHMIPRYNWTNNTVYSSYDQNDPNLYDEQFYVLNSNYEVYKCIDNNGGANSTVQPSLPTTTGVFSTSDGYVWKYMYTVDSNANTKFTSTSYIPVTPNTQVANNATPGSIDFIKVTNGGNNYQGYNTGYLQNFANAYILQIANTASPIDGRYANSSIYLKTGFGSGQLRNILFYNGLNRLVTVSQPFDTYTVLNVSNTNGTITTGLVATQRIDNLYYLYSQGFFNANDTIIQSDTGASGTILQANNTAFRVNKTSNADFSTNLPVYNTSQSATLKTGTVDVVTNEVRTITITSNGSGYPANATISIANVAGDTTGSGAAANAHANSTGRIDVINITNKGTSYTLPPSVTISPPPAMPFNANTNVDIVHNFITLGSNGAYFANGDQVTYLVAAGNTALTGLTNNSVYYVVDANSVGFSISTSSNGTPITLTKGKTETGHSFTGQTATANASILSIYVTANTVANMAAIANVGSYIRVGDNANNNIRRVVAANATTITVDTAFTTNAAANTIYYVPIAAEPTSVTVSLANGVISNTNLNSVILAYNNAAINSLLFTVGERVDMVGSDNVTQGANGIISYSNSTAVILSSVSGTFLTGPNNFILGISSLQKANILSSVSFPNITVSTPIGTYLSGQQIYIRTLPDLTAVGNATLISSFQIPNELTEYIISPSVNITGDGSGALAYSVVNTNFNSSNNIESIVVLNPGKGYTYANVSVTANSSFGNGATAEPIIAPTTGHGANAYAELGARYAGISMTMDTGENEGYKFPVFGKYRRIGILENPLFNDASITVNDYDRVNLTIANRAGSGFSNDEFLIQPSSNAAGIIVTANSTFIQLKSVEGTFTANGTGDNIVGLTTGTTANVSVANVVEFALLSNVEIISEVYSNTTADIVEANSSVLKLTNISGKFQANDTIYDSVSNAYANVVSITIANGTVDATANFGQKFSQVARLTLTSNSGSGFFQVGEVATQNVTGAFGTIISTNTDIDIVYTNSNGSFSVGNQLSDANSGAMAVVTFANTTYLRLTSVANGVFTAGHRIINNVNIGADISSVYSVIVMNDVNGNNAFQTGTYPIVGSQSSAVGRNQITGTILYPELVRDTGSVIYIENIAPITRSATAKEQINLVIKF
jgi:hypothetical protein